MLEVVERDETVNDGLPGDELAQDDQVMSPMTQVGVDPLPAIPGQHLSSLISMVYIFGFRKDNAIFFNNLGQNYPVCTSLKRLCH